jgi:hypothetical protein
VAGSATWPAAQRHEPRPQPEGEGREGGERQLEGAGVRYM